MFVLDTSKHIAKKLPQVKAFVKEFAATFTSSSNTRYALVTYSTHVQTYITLKEYTSSTFSSMLDYVRTGRDRKSSHLGLEEAGRLFKEESAETTKKVVIVISNGFSESRYHNTVITNS